MQKNGKYTKKSNAPSGLILCVVLLAVIGSFGISAVIFFKIGARSVSKAVETAPSVSETKSAIYESIQETDALNLEVKMETTSPPIETSTQPIVETTSPTEAASPPSTEPPAQPKEKTGTVLRSAGELKVRSGAGTDYNEVSRLQGGQSVTIYNERQVGNSVWGDIGYGWVCMDYIVFGEDTSAYPAYNQVTSTVSQNFDEYYGNWVSNNGTNMYIRANNSGFAIDVISSNSLQWILAGEYGEGAIFYHGKCLEGNITKYSNANGIIVLQDGVLHWHEAIEGSGDFMTFMKTGANISNSTNQYDGMNNQETSLNQSTTMPTANPSNQEYNPPVFTKSAYQNIATSHENLPDYTLQYYKNNEETIFRILRYRIFKMAHIDGNEDRDFNITITYMRRCWSRTDAIYIEAEGELEGRKFIMGGELCETVNGIGIDNLGFGMSVGWVDDIEE